MIICRNAYDCMHKCCSSGTACDSDKRTCALGHAPWSKCLWQSKQACTHKEVFRKLRPLDLLTVTEISVEPCVFMHAAGVDSCMENIIIIFK